MSRRDVLETRVDLARWWLKHLYERLDPGDFGGSCDAYDAAVERAEAQRDDAERQLTAYLSDAAAWDVDG